MSGVTLYCRITCTLLLNQSVAKPKILDISTRALRAIRFPAYRYMCLKTYAKFTFCIKSPGHVPDENFLYYCMHLASKISSYRVRNISDKKTHFYLLFKFSIFFDMYLTTYMDIFSHIFKMVTPRALRQLLPFITLDYLTAFIANLRSHLIPVHYKTSTTCTSKRTF